MDESELTAAQRRLLAWLRGVTEVDAIELRGADLYVKASSGGWVVHPDAEKPWPIKY
jgi:hypothetical protein